MAQVFISYAHNDEAFVVELKKHIKAAGFDVWLDRDLLQPGQNWRDEIDNAIKASFALIIVMTQDSSESQYVTYEWAYALGLGKVILPILRETAALHPRLEVVQHLDFSDPTKYPWDRLVKHLQEVAAQLDEQGRLQPPPIVQAAIVALNSPNPDDRAQAISSLTATRHTSALSALGDALNHPVAGVREKAVYALGQPEGLPYLLEALRAGEGVNRKDIIEVLGYVGSPVAIPDLVNILDDPIADLRASAAYALGRLSDPNTTPGLLKAAKDVDPDVRRVAVEALGKSDNPDVVPDLVPYLHDNDSRVRLATVLALKNIGSFTAAPSLMECLDDDDHNIRMNAAGVLGELGDPSVVSGLIDALEDRHASVRQQAAEALGALGDKQAVSPLLTALHDEAPNVRRVAARALGILNDPAAVPGLLELLNDYEVVMLNAARALGEIGNPVAAEPLLKALDEVSKEGVDDVEDALIAVSDASVIPLLSSTLRVQSNAETVRVAAARALEPIDDLRTIETWLYAMTDPAISIQRTAARVLRRFGDRAVPALVDLINHEDSDHRTLAARALNVIGTESAVAALDQWKEDKDW